MDNNRVRRVLPALALVGAVFVAGSAGGAVAAAGLITGLDIKDGSITSKDIKDKAIKAGDLSKKTLSALQGATGPRGPAGPAGVAGPAGAPGSAGPSGLNDFEFIVDSTDVLADEAADLSLVCPVGKTLIDVNGWWSFSSAAVQALPLNDGTGAIFTEGVPVDDELFISVSCAVVDLAELPRPSGPFKG